MEFKVSSTNLLKQLQVLSGVIETTSGVPILSNFLFDIDKNELNITASDSETKLSATIDIESEEKESIAIPANTLLETLKTFPDQPLTFKKLDENRLEILSEQGTYDMVYEDGDEYPKTQEEDLDKNSVSLPPELLLKAINTTLFAVDSSSQDVTRGMLIEFEQDSINFVATNGYKLARYSRKNVQINRDTRADEDNNFIVSHKPLTLLKSFLTNRSSENEQNEDKKVEINYNEKNVRFTFDNTVMTARLVDGKYPNYKKIIRNTKAPNELCVDRIALLNATKRATIYAGDLHQIYLDITNKKLEISAQDLNYGKSSNEALSCKYQGENIKIGFNAKVIAEILRHIISQDITIHLINSESQGIITPTDQIEGEEITMLLMPMRQ